MAFVNFAFAITIGACATLLEAAPPYAILANAPWVTPMVMAPALYALGQPAAAGEVEVVVSAVNVVAMKARPGRLLVTAEYRVRNISSAEVELAGLHTLYLESSDGRVFDPLDRGMPPSGQLRPGAVVAGQARFEIPADGFDKSLWRLRYGGPMGPRIRLE